MGWSSGSEIFSEIIESLIEAEVEDSQRETIYNRLIEVFVDMDCDTLYECLDKDSVFDKCLNELYPDETEEEYDD